MKYKLIAALLLGFATAYCLTMTEYEFTRVTANLLKKSFPGSQIEFLGDLQISFTDSSGIKSALYLADAYSDYLLDPDDYENIIGRHIRAIACY